MNAPLPEPLRDYRVVIELPIQWSDQDAFGHVNNTVPIRWFESARIAYLERPELSGLLAAEGVGPILAAVSCNFRRQLHYPDTVLIGARVVRIGRSSLDMEHHVFSHRHNAIASDGVSKCVIFDYATQKPRRVSDALRAAMERLEGGSIAG